MCGVESNERDKERARKGVSWDKRGQEEEGIGNCSSGSNLSRL
jgi:hypothetical protein